MNCSSCGAGTRAGATFCGECGAKLPGATMPTTAPPPPPPPPIPEARAATDGNPFIIAAPPAVPSATSTDPAHRPNSLAEAHPEIDEKTTVSTRRGAKAWYLEISGQRHPVGRSLLVGRDAAADGRWPDAGLLSVVDPTKTVSKTHAAFEVDGVGLWVTDLTSTNGVFIEHAGSETQVVAGERTTVPADAQVSLGDFEFMVVN